MHDRWLACVNQLEAEVPAQLYKTWIKPLTFIAYDESEHVLRLGAPNQFKLNWVRNQFGTRISQLAGSIIDPHTKVVFEISVSGGLRARREGDGAELSFNRLVSAPAATVTVTGGATVAAPALAGSLVAAGQAGWGGVADSYARPNETDGGAAHDKRGEPDRRSDPHIESDDLPAQAAPTYAAPEESRRRPNPPSAARTTEMILAERSAQALAAEPPGRPGVPTPARPSSSDASRADARSSDGPTTRPGAGPVRSGSTKTATGHGASGEPPLNERTKLRFELTFDSFVTGKSNQMARAAALQVVDRPGTSYNPLFLYGGVGLGKTHLIHAVGNSILERNRGARVRYIHAQEYFEEMVRAIQKKSPDEWKSAYQSLDLLLIDDIQFLSGKPRTQEEFFYTFDALFAARKQIIITCDTYPKEIAGVEERLISRFDSGLIVAIEPPELEMRVAILHKKAETSGAELPDDVAFFIAKHLRSNVRELEGALLRVVAYAGFRNKPMTLELAKEALDDLLALNRRQISIDVIQKTTADFFKLKVADMYGKRRLAHIVLPRQIAMYLAKELTQKSLPEIGEAFGRDHTTVLHAVRKIAENRQHDPDLNHNLHVLEQTLRG